MNQNQWLNRLQQQFNENPLGTIAIGSLATTAAAKLLSSINDARRSRVWAREIERRERMTYGRRPPRR